MKVKCINCIHCSKDNNGYYCKSLEVFDTWIRSPKKKKECKAYKIRI